jgi:hypothetical protein
LEIPSHFFSKNFSLQIHSIPRLFFAAQKPSSATGEKERRDKHSEGRVAPLFCWSVGARKPRRLHSRCKCERIQGGKSERIVGIFGELAKKSAEKLMMTNGNVRCKKWEVY